MINIYNMCLLLGLNSQQCSCSTMRLAKTRVQRKRKRPSQVYIGIDVQSSIAYPEAGSEETKNWDTPLAFHVCLSNQIHHFIDFQISLLIVFADGIFVHCWNLHMPRETRWPFTLGTISLPSSSWLSLPSAGLLKVGPRQFPTL